MVESRASTQIDGGMCACNKSIHMVSFMVQMSRWALPFCGEVYRHESYIRMLMGTKNEVDA
jgi:hypothetical protein